MVRANEIAQLRQARNDFKIKNPGWVLLIKNFKRFFTHVWDYLLNLIAWNLKS